MKSTRPGTRRLWSASFPGLSRLVAMKMNGSDTTPPFLATTHGPAAARQWPGRRTRDGLANRERALHASFGMTWDGAEVRVLALLVEADDELCRLAGLDQRRLLPRDPEVVQHMADVLEGEGHFAGLCSRLDRGPEEKLPTLDLDRNALRARRGSRVAARPRAGAR